MTDGCAAVMPGEARRVTANDAPRGARLVVAQHPSAQAAAQPSTASGKSTGQREARLANPLARWRTSITRSAMRSNAVASRAIRAGRKSDRPIELLFAGCCRRRHVNAARGGRHCDPRSPSSAIPRRCSIRGTHTIMRARCDLLSSASVTSSVARRGIATPSRTPRRRDASGSRSCNGRGFPRLNRTGT